MDNREPSGTTIHSGQAVTNRHTALASTCAMGLKVKLPDGTEGITTVTHGFVKLNGSMRNLKLGLFEWYTRIKKALSSFRYPCRLPFPTYIATKTSLLTNNPLGKEVFLLRICSRYISRGRLLIVY